MSELSNEESKQKEYYNSIAEDYDNHYSSDYALEYRHLIYDEFMSGLDLSSMKVLDAMCGGGQNTSYFKGKVEAIEGIDISEEQVALYNKNHPYAVGRCGSILDTKYEDNQFDLIVIESLHHLHPYVNAGIEELKRILKPGGYIFIWEPLEGTLMDWCRIQWYKVDSKFFQDNEASISLNKIKKKHKHSLTVNKYRNGGGIAYLLVSGSMFFRIPQWLVREYAKPLTFIEKLMDPIRPKVLCCWTAALLQKNKN